MRQPSGENYLNKKDMLNFIHQSKATFTWYVDSNRYKDTKYYNYDLIVCGEDMYNEAKAQLMLQTINTRRREAGMTRASVLRDTDIPLITEEDYANIDNRILPFNGMLTDNMITRAKLGKYNRELYAVGKNRVQVLPADIDYSLEDLVIRVYTYSHIPVLDVESGKERKVAHYHEKVHFPPYLHYGYYNGTFMVVAKSHHNKKNEFSVTSGFISRELAEVYLLQSRRVSYKHNTKGYSYIDDMVSQANVQLVSVGLQFNELFSDNPFAYFTTIITNSFKTVLKEEKRIRDHRDLMLMEAGVDPSYTEQIRQENSRQEHWNNVLAEDSDSDSDNLLDQNSNWAEHYTEDNSNRNYNDLFYQNSDDVNEFMDMELDEVVDTELGLEDITY